MAATVKLPTALRRMVGGAATLEAPAGTLGEVLESLEEQFPGFKARILDDHSKNIHPFISIFINGDDVRYLRGLNATVGEGDEITIVPAIAGGAPTGVERRRLLRRRPFGVRPLVWIVLLVAVTLLLVAGVRQER